MERIVQLLDDLDDLVAMVGLLSERLRNVVLLIAGGLSMLTLLVGGIVLGLMHPPIALATALILFMALLYQSVTSPRFAPALK